MSAQMPEDNNGRDDDFRKRSHYQTNPPMDYKGKNFQKTARRGHDDVPNQSPGNQVATINAQRQRLAAANTIRLAENANNIIEDGVRIVHVNISFSSRIQIGVPNIVAAGEHPRAQQLPYPRLHHIRQMEAARIYQQQAFAQARIQHIRAARAEIVRRAEFQARVNYLEQQLTIARRRVNEYTQARELARVREAELLQALQLVGMLERALGEALARVRICEHLFARARFFGQARPHAFARVRVLNQARSLAMSRQLAQELEAARAGAQAMAEIRRASFEQARDRAQVLGQIRTLALARAREQALQLTREAALRNGEQAWVPSIIHRVVTQHEVLYRQNILDVVLNLERLGRL